MRAAGDRRSQDDVLLAAVAAEKRLEGRQQNHEKGGPGAPGEPLEPLCQLVRQGEGQARSHERLDRRPRPVGRQIQHLRRPGELGSPVGELPLQHLACEPLPLPDRIVRVLDRQLGQERRPTFDRRPIELRHLLDQDSGRPPVGRDVVQGQEQDVAFRRQAQERRPPDRAPSQVEGARGLRAGQPRRLPLLRRRRDSVEIDHGQRERLSGLADRLHRPLCDHRKYRAQRLVPPLHLAERPGERRRPQPAHELQGGRNVVLRAVGFQLVEKPQPLLGEGER